LIAPEDHERDQHRHQQRKFYRGCALNIRAERRTKTWKFVFIATDKSTLNERSPLELYVVLITFLPSARVNRALK